MAFTRDDLVSYETKPQIPVEGFDPFNPTATPAVAQEPETSPQVDADAEVDAAITASVNAEPSENGTNDGSTTDTQAETVAADDATPEGAKDPDVDENVGDGKPRSRAQERIEELVAERNALRRYGEYLLAQVEAVRQNGAPKGDQSASQPAVNDTKEDAPPTLETADYDPAKLELLRNEWIQKQVEKRVENALKQLETRQSEVAVRQAFEQKAAEFRKASPDFDIVMSNPDLPALSPAAARVIIQADNGPAIAYHLAKNPDLAVRIAKMEPVGQAAAIGRLEEQLVRTKTETTTNTAKEPSKTSAPAKKQVAVTQAPPPPKPVQGSAPHKKDETIMSMDEWVSNERAKKIQEKKSRQEMRRAMR